jgi:hypothetical protein
MLVGAYLKMIEECEIVAYGQHSPIEGEQMEIDVIGIQPNGEQEIITCEVATHLRGLGYGTATENAEKVASKFKHAEKYVDRTFGSKESHRFQFWSPNVPPASATKLNDVADEFRTRTNTELELVINREYTDRVNELKRRAEETVSQRNELAFRLLQILAHLKSTDIPE